MTFTFERHGPGADPALLSEVAHLRLAVLRDVPCLYGRAPEDETRMLRGWFGGPGSLVVALRHRVRMVGAAVALPLRDAPPELRRPFEERGFDARNVLCIAGPVLLPPYRGRGLGLRFFRECEAHARALGDVRFLACLTVNHPPDHPRRPRADVPLDDRFARRGFARISELQAVLTWRDLDEPDETPKPITFWLKELT